VELTILAVIVGVLSLSGPALADERSQRQAAQEVTVRMTEYQYEPSHIELRKGQPVELRLVNEGKELHEFVTEALVDTPVDVESQGVIAAARGLDELEVPAGATVVLRFTPGKAGQFSFRCDAESPVSHLKSGMKGSMTIR
jgi:uncharacterized cupredoxin-like copper-binding protein